VFVLSRNARLITITFFLVFQVICGPIDEWFVYTTDNLVEGGANALIEVVRQTMADLAEILAVEHNLEFPRSGFWQYDNGSENKVTCLGPLPLAPCSFPLDLCPLSFAPCSLPLRNWQTRITDTYAFSEQDNVCLCQLPHRAKFLGQSPH